MHKSTLLFAMLMTGCELFGLGPTPEDDAGVPPPDGGAATCEALGFEGRCVGTELWFCPTTEVVRSECTLDGPHIACVDGFPGWGAACAVDEGEVCGFVYPDGSDSSYLCTATEAGCVWSSTGARCVSFVGTCTDADVGSCRGSLQIVGCTAGQAAANDCASWGGACAPGRCVEMPEGSPCDGVRSICASGLTCGTDSLCGRTGGGGASLTLTILDEPTLRDDRLRNHHVHLYLAEPYAYLGDRPADVPEPVATADFTDWVVTFEGLAPGTYWYDFHWIADTNRMAYGVGRVEVVEGANSAVATWRYWLAPGPYQGLDMADPWAVLVVFSDDPDLDLTTNPTFFRIESAAGEIGSATAYGRWSSEGTRCGQSTLGSSLMTSHPVVHLAPGTYSVRGWMWYPPVYDSYVWHAQTVTVAAEECAFVNLGSHDCVGLGC